jgi:hypothetical protein
MWVDFFAETIPSRALILTLGGVVWYSLETYRLREETRRLREVTEKQVNIETLTVVSVKNIAGDKLTIENIGKHLALNVKVEKVGGRLHPSRPKSSPEVAKQLYAGKYSFTFANIVPFINSSEEKTMGISSIPPIAGQQNPNIDAFLNPENNFFQGSYDIKISYENMIREKIFTLYSVSKEKGIVLTDISIVN